MGKLIRSAWIVATAPVALLLASGTASAADPTIDAFEAGQQAAWNAHDATAYAAAFDGNADIITALGWHWTGQADAAHNLGDGFRFVYAKARLRLSDVHVRILTPEFASVTLSWSIDGARTIDAGAQAGEQHGFETQLLQRRGGSWIILAQQDTLSRQDALSRPERAAAPLPASSPPPEQAAPPASTFPTTPPPVRRCIVARKNGQCLIYGKPKPAPAS